MPISDTGIAMPGINVARQLRRKMNTTAITRHMEIISVRSTSLTEARMVVVRSRTMVVSVPNGMDALMYGICARIASTVWMMLAPGWRKMISITARLPLRYPAARTFCTESVTCAMSESRTALPRL